MKKIHNIIFSYDFFPKIGGAHLWLYEVGKRWPEPTMVITSNFQEQFKLQKSFDSLTHGSIREINRLPFKITGWGIDLNFFKNLWKMIQVFKRIRSSNPIVVHCVKAIPETVSILFIKYVLKQKLKIITYAHGEEFLIAKTSRQLKWLTKLALNCSDLVIANSYSTKGLASSFYDESKIKVVHLGVDFVRYQLSHVKRETWRKNWGFAKDTIILITMARMEPRKNHGMVLRALAELRKEGLPLAYVIGGEGEEEERLRQLSMDLGIQPWVKFLGQISEEDKIKSFCAADIHIMPSIHVGSMIEGFGIVFMEAAAAGLPSIAGNVGGQPEAVIYGKTGLVIDGRDVEQIKGAVKRLALNSEERIQMGNEARKWAKEHDWSNIVKKIYAIVKDIGVN
ncbi:GDP-mannose-dependent alpha-(1-6)-phosphatidylinositol monomannoside mannosyltransferase [Desulfothermus naphthae]